MSQYGLHKDKEWNVMQHIVSYYQYPIITKKDNNLIDAIHFAVWKRLRENNHIRKEDIQQYNLIGKLYWANFYLNSQFRFFC